MTPRIFVCAVLVVLTTVGIPPCEAGSPVSNEAVNAIRKKTQKWEPADPSQNPFANFTEEQLRTLLGLKIGTVPTSEPNLTP